MDLHSVRIFGTFKCQDISNIPIWSPEQEGRLVYVSTTNTFYFADNLQYNIVKNVKSTGTPKLLDRNLNSNFYIIPDNITLLYDSEMVYNKTYFWNNILPCYNIKNYKYSLYNIFTIPKYFLLNTNIDFYIIYSTVSDDINSKIKINIDIYDSTTLLTKPIIKYVGIELTHTKFDEISTISLSDIKLKFLKLPDICAIKISKTEDDFIGNIKIIDIFLKQSNIKYDVFNSYMKLKYIVSDLSIYDIINSTINYSTPILSNTDHGHLFLTSLWDSDLNLITIILPSPSPGTTFAIKKDPKIKTIIILTSNSNISINGSKTLQIINDTINDDSIISFIATSIYDYQIKSKPLEWRDNDLFLIQSETSKLFFEELTRICYFNRANQSLLTWVNYVTLIYAPSGDAMFLNLPITSYNKYELYKDFDVFGRFFGINIGSDLNLYCIPFDSESIYKINLDYPEYDLEFGSIPGSNKYAGGVLASDGNIYCIPYNANNVLKIIPGDNPSYEILFDGFIGSGSAKYVGGILAPDGNIYCIPHNANNILKIIPGDNPVYSFITSPNITSDLGKWYSGVLGGDGCIYCVPYNSSFILKIDSINNIISVTGEYSGTKKWCGGTISEDGYIYFTPHYYQKILKLKPGLIPTFTLIDFGNLPAQNQSAVLGLDGISYSFPTNKDVRSFEAGSGRNRQTYYVYDYYIMGNYGSRGFNGMCYYPDEYYSNLVFNNNPIYFTSGYTALGIPIPVTYPTEIFFRGSILAPNGHIYSIRDDGKIFKLKYNSQFLINNGYEKFPNYYLLSAYLNKL
jgi:hypothetical protein